MCLGVAVVIGLQHFSRMVRDQGCCSSCLLAKWSVVFQGVIAVAIHLDVSVHATWVD